MLFLFLLCLPLPVRAGTAQDLLAETFLLAQTAMSSAAGQALSQIGQRAAAGDGVLADLLRDRQAVEKQLADTETALTDPAADPVHLTGEAEALAARIREIDTRIGTEFPRFADLTRPRPAPLTEVQALLDADEALILMFSGAEKTFVWAVTAKAAAWHAVSTDPATLADVVARLRETLDPASAPVRAAAALDSGFAPSAAAFPRDLAWRLHAFLLAPLMPVFGTARHVYIVPDGPLSAIPFALLPTEPPEGADDDPAAMRATPWMIRQHALTVLPAVDSLRVIRDLPPPDAGRRAFMGFGDPDFGGTMQVAGLTQDLAQGPGVMRGGLADPDQLRALAPLPQTRRELRAIAATLGAAREDVVLGMAATERAVKSATLSDRRVLAFATHGLLSGEIRGLDEPALVLSPPDRPDAADDGLLTASEIADLNLDADWVILSACNTAGGESPGAEGLSGLARAFLFAGARAVLVSHWPVRDDAAARLTTEAFARLASGRATGKAEALRQSMLALMEDDSDPTLAHPAAWAPFILVGDGR
ncbi:CHAT domain-containing protein [Szabonella alba]|uniref:CHAT domain-containing protein n=1 Tax=Szabonella alba TaxID=2804194 RepID=A0A8K0VFX9_9RHOB|nr:CHAT domain-containing protein [Szabonella alba]MBL4918310.1 CHAT domain-containing protein [Szabonella alba]